MTVTNDETALTASIKLKLKEAGELKWQRYPLPHTHPSFKSCAIAATRLLQEIEGAKAILVMRDVCLRPVRELILKSGLNLIIPNRYGTGIGLIPQHAMADGVLRIDPPPPGTTPYTGDIDVVIVGCLAFNRAEKRLYTYEAEHTASVLDELRQGLDSGFTLNSNVPVVAVCADQQQVEGWPSSAQGFVEAGAVVTPTRTLVLGHSSQ
jgi:5-formyltetrahydrofolate cyclo-ligase